MRRSGSFRSSASAANGPATVNQGLTVFWQWWSGALRRRPDGEFR